jgi:hypothetical protein
MATGPIANNAPRVYLDDKAHRAVIEALRFQLDAWKSRGPDDLEEGDFIDLQNDIGYLEILLHSLEDEYKQRY